MLGLNNLKRIPSGYMCSCPICREGKSPWRTRLYILTEKKSFITVYCHNCGYDTNLKMFIKDTNPYLFEEYKKEEREQLLTDLKNGTVQCKEVKIKNELNNDLNLKYTFTLSNKYFKKATENLKAIEFCKRRKIEEHIDKFYYNVNPNHILSGMIIFPFYFNDGKTLYGFQGRHTENKVFHTHSKNEALKIYNFYNVNYEEPVYIFEAIIDSLMMENSMAMLGVSLSEAVLNRIRKPVYILDNDKRGLQTALQYAKEDKTVFIYPNSFKYKDFNEAVCKGMKKSELKQMVRENTHQGFSAVVKLNLILSGRKF